MTKTGTNAQALSVVEMLAGGDDPYQPHAVEALTKNGKAGIIYTKKLPASVVMEYSKLPKEQQTGEGLAELVEQAVVTKTGEPMFGEGFRFRDVPAAAFFEVSAIVMNEFGEFSEAGEVSGETKAVGSVSPTG